MKRSVAVYAAIIGASILAIVLLVHVGELMWPTPAAVPAVASGDAANPLSQLAANAHHPLARLLLQLLTIILAAYLLAGGVMRIFLAIGYRSQFPGAWAWVLISGIVDIVLSLIIMMGLPGTAVWVLGLLVGINLLMMGFSIVMVAMSVRRALPKEAGAKETGAKPA